MFETLPRNSNGRLIISAKTPHSEICNELEFLFVLNAARRFCLSAQPGATEPADPVLKMTMNLCLNLSHINLHPLMVAGFQCSDLKPHTKSN
jgi:hypothetical protein